MARGSRVVAFVAMADIGSTLREARMRARIDISEVETRTKIRAKYLRAIENEEWDLLPGPVYVKSFLRTYGDYLGLDSRMLIDEYKRRYERPTDHEMRPIVALQPRARARRRGPAAAVVGVDRRRAGAVVVALYVRRSSATAQQDAGDHRQARTTRASTTDTPTHAPGPRTAATASRRPSSSSSSPTGTVYVCLVDGAGKQADPRSRSSAPADDSDRDGPQAAAHARQRVGPDEGQRQGRHGRAVGSAIGFLLQPSGRRTMPARPAADVRMSGRRDGPRAGILITGTEVLTGIISDRNGPWLSERLREIGVDAAVIQIVGDRPGDLLAALRFMADEGMALIVTSGGLGPTADDLTAEIVGEFSGREMVLDSAPRGADRRDLARR